MKKFVINIGYVPATTVPLAELWDLTIRSVRLQDATLEDLVDVRQEFDRQVEKHFEREYKENPDPTEEMEQRWAEFGVSMLRCLDGIAHKPSIAQPPE